MTAPLRVLLVEDNPSDAKLVLHALRALGREIVHHRVETEAELGAALDEAGWDFIVCDWSLPQFDAPRAIRVVSSRALDVPFFVVSGTLTEDLAVSAMRAGAHDVVLKSNLARLVPALEREIREAGERAARRRAEQAVENEQRRFRALVERSTAGIVLSGADDAVVYASPAACRMFGCAPDELVGTRASDRFLPTAPSVAVVTAQLLATPGTPISTTRTIRRPDGTSCIVELTLTNALADPAVNGIIANLRDVTERTANRAELERAQRRFSRVFESGLIGVVIAEVAGTFVDANDAYLGLIGYSRDELSGGGLTWMDVTVPEAEANQSAAASLQARGMAGPYETVVRAKDGTLRPVLCGMAAIDEASIIAFVVDLSEKKRAEAHLEETERQLRHAQKMEAVGRLAGGIAHDFNNILFAILSFTEILLDDLHDHPTAPDVTAIQQAATRGADLTRQLLSFSRQQVVAPRIVDLEEVIRNIAPMLRRLLGERVELELELARDCRVFADPTALDQILMNLVVNARDAMPSGGRLLVAVTPVKIEAGDPRRDEAMTALEHVELRVADDGSGMDEATLARVFEPFFTTKPIGQGTGLGLSTVFGIVHQAGGSIRVASSLGAGTTFTIYLPREARMAAETARPGPKREGGHETILLVEDDPILRGVACTILRRAGYRVLEARTTDEALRFADEEQPIDLLLTDVVMPGLLGPELADRLVEKRPTLRVLCMSGYTDGVTGESIGRWPLLQKPLRREALLAAIRDRLDAPG